MARSHWLVKSEPAAYSWDDLVKQPRLSVMPIDAQSFRRIVEKGGAKLQGVSPSGGPRGAPSGSRS